MCFSQEFANATEKLNKIAVSIENHNDANNFTVETISLGLLLESVHDSRQFYQAQYPFNLHLCRASYIAGLFVQLLNCPILTDMLDFELH